MKDELKYCKNCDHFVKHNIQLNPCQNCKRNPYLIDNWKRVT